MARPTDITAKEWSYAWRCMISDGRSLPNVIQSIRERRQFIAIDEHGIAIQAIGATADDAISTAIRDAGPLFDADGNDLTDDQAREKFVAMPATPALIAQVEAEGGAIAWGEIDGTACTVEEEEAAA
jgi:hypothetical protein